MPWEVGGLKVIKYTFTLKQTFDKAASGTSAGVRTKWLDLTQVLW